MPDGKVRENAYGQVAGEWARYDPEAVSVWINGLPHDRSRDAAIGQLVDRIAKTDPETANNQLIFPTEETLSQVHLIDPAALKNTSYNEQWQAVLGA